MTIIIHLVKTTRNVNMNEFISMTAGFIWELTVKTRITYYIFLLPFDVIVCCPFDFTISQRGVAEITLYGILKIIRIKGYATTGCTPWEDFLFFHLVDFLFVTSTWMLSLISIIKVFQKIMCLCVFCL